MADYLVTDLELTSIANAIRDKADIDDELTFPNEFISTIENITTEPDELVIWPETHFTISGSSSSYDEIDAPDTMIAPTSGNDGLLDITYDGVLYEDTFASSEGVYLDNFSFFKNTNTQKYRIWASGGNHTIKAVYKRAKTETVYSTICENYVINGTYHAETGDYWATLYSSTATTQTIWSRCNTIKIIANGNTYTIDNPLSTTLNLEGHNLVTCYLGSTWYSDNEVYPGVQLGFFGPPNTAINLTISIYAVKNDDLIVAPHGTEYFTPTPGTYDVATFRNIQIGELELENITITPTATTQVFSANTSLGYQGLSLVTVLPPILSALTVNPTNQAQIITPSSSYVGFSQVTVGPGTADAYVQRLFGTLDSYTNSTLTSIISYAFNYCSTLSSANFTNVTEIGSSAFYHCTSLETIILPNVTSIYNYAFNDCFKLQSLNLPEVTYMGSYAFAYNSSLATISCPKLKDIGSNTFYGCVRLTAASFPAVTIIPSSAFGSCVAMGTASFPAATSIYNYAFSYCRALTTFYGPKVTYVGTYAFSWCSQLANITFSTALTGLGTGAFYQCSAITSFNFPSLKAVASSAFAGCKNATNYNLPLVSVVYPSAFAGNQALTTISLPSCSAIGASAFYNCANLMSIYLMSTTKMATLSNVTAFYSTPMSVSQNGVYGSIFVPAALYASYIAATNWTTYSARIVSVS